MFLEWWNITKSLSNIWQRFWCLLDKGTAKICKNFNSHDGFLRADQGRAKNCCQIGRIGCPILQVAHKATLRFEFLAYFCNPLIKLTWKLLSSVGKTFYDIPPLNKHTVISIWAWCFSYFISCFSLPFMQGVIGNIRPGAQIIFEVACYYS